METGAFEKVLAEKWSVIRSDIYVKGFGPPALAASAQPIRPDRVLQRLKVSQDELVGLIQSGQLPRPGVYGPDRVAWRRDEVDALVPLADRR